MDIKEKLYDKYSILLNNKDLTKEALFSMLDEYHSIKSNLPESEKIDELKAQIASNKKDYVKEFKETNNYWYETTKALETEVASYKEALRHSCENVIDLHDKANNFEYFAIKLSNDIEQLGKFIEPEYSIYWKNARVTIKDFKEYQKTFI